MQKMMPVGYLRRLGVSVVSVDRDAGIPAPSDQVATNRWLRPRLLGNRPVLLVRAEGPGRWRNVDHQRRHGNTYPISSARQLEFALDISSTER